MLPGDGTQCGDAWIVVVLEGHLSDEASSHSVWSISHLLAGHASQGRRSLREPGQGC